MKLGLYSITYLGIWYRGGALTLPEFFLQAKKLGYSGVEIDGKRPHGNPMDLDGPMRKQLKTMAADEGLEIFAVAANSDFTDPVVEHRECQLLMARDLIQLTADLGAPVMRIFMAWPGVTCRADGLAQYDISFRRWEELWRDTTRHEAWEFARDAMAELARIAADQGVVLCLQNHGPVIRDYRDVLDIVDEVGSPALQVCLDAPLLTCQDTAAVRRAVQETGSRQVLSHFGGEFRRNVDGKVVWKGPDHGESKDRPEVNYAEFLRALKQTGYDGYLAYEFCHLALDEQHRGPLGRDYVDQQAGFAAEFMRELMQEVGVYSDAMAEVR